ncbi:hypothetical protein [Croceicoccus sp. Ery15]|uniref:hypothetical protein n=1 Tax=Croceicoccus sp. Ery15 TaxID=1703338 RepID=UPI00351D4882
MSPHDDPMIAKLAAHAHDRSMARTDLAHLAALIQIYPFRSTSRVKRGQATRRNSTRIRLFFMGRLAMT